MLILRKLICIILAKILKCYCEGQCPDGVYNGTCITKPGGLCFSSVTREEADDGDYEDFKSYGCMAPHDHGGFLQVIENCHSQNFYYSQIFFLS